MPLSDIDKIDIRGRLYETIRNSPRPISKTMASRLKKLPEEGCTTEEFAEFLRKVPGITGPYADFLRDIATLSLSIPPSLQKDIRSVLDYLPVWLWEREQMGRGAATDQEFIEFLNDRAPNFEQGNELRVKFFRALTLTEDGKARPFADDITVTIVFGAFPEFLAAKKEHLWEKAKIAPDLATIYFFPENNVPFYYLQEALPHQPAHKGAIKTPDEIRRDYHEFQSFVLQSIEEIIAVSPKKYADKLPAQGQKLVDKYQVRQKETLAKLGDIRTARVPNKRKGPIAILETYQEESSLETYQEESSTTTYPYEDVANSIKGITGIKRNPLLPGRTSLHKIIKKTTLHDIEISWLTQISRDFIRETLEGASSSSASNSGNSESSPSENAGSFAQDMNSFAFSQEAPSIHTMLAAMNASLAKAYKEKGIESTKFQEYRVQFQEYKEFDFPPAQLLDFIKEHNNDLYHYLQMAFLSSAKKNWREHITEDVICKSLAKALGGSVGPVVLGTVMSDLNKGKQKEAMSR